MTVCQTACSRYRSSS